MGAYHTLDLEAGRDFTLIKEVGGWDSIGIDRVNEATAVAGGAEVGAIVCGEGKAPPPVDADTGTESLCSVVRDS